MATTDGPCKEPAPPFLRLPPPIRHRIYRFVGLASWNGRPYDFDLRGTDDLLKKRDLWDLDIWTFETPRPNTFHGLLLSCRAIYAEAAALLYSANRFVISYTDPGSLQPLLALTAPTLSTLAALKIVLNQASCHQRTRFRPDRDCCFRTINTRKSECQKRHQHRHQRPLLSPTPEDGDGRLTAVRALLGDWHAAARHVSSHIATKRLEISLVCDIDARHRRAVDLADLVLEPLRLFPFLRSCHIRLCETPDARLLRVAQDAVSQACGIAPPYLKPSASTDTAFVTLPRELRLRILELTDLVTPTKEVRWSRQHSKYRWVDLAGGRYCANKDPPGWCNRTAFECWYRSYRPTGPFIGCFCRRRHAAFSATCTCWAPPDALFLVCRALHEDARFVFFSANRFVVHDFKLFPVSLVPDPPDARPGTTENVGCDYPYERFAASQFLREVVPPSCIAYLRFLELVFPPYPPGTWPPTEHPVMRDWRETVRWLRNKINGPGLTLRLVGAELLWDEPNPEPMTVAEGDKIHRAYMDLLQPLEQLAQGPNALARFYADLPYPWQWTEENQRQPSFWLWRDAQKEVVKRNAERRVMGDRYDSQYANGKKEPELSDWQHVIMHHE